MRFEYGTLRFPALILLYLTTCPRPSFQQQRQQQPTNGQSSSQTAFLSNAQDILEHQLVQNLRLECDDKLTGPIETTLCDYESVESVNQELLNSLNELVNAPFFKYFRTDLYRECPFWQENGFCMNRECGITTVDESEIPLAWRAAALSQVQVPTEEQRNSLPGCYYRDADFCFHDDESSIGDYIDLTQNPERFTGYSGPPTHRVWTSIYQENCFGISESSLNKPPSENKLFGINSDEDYICEEMRIYYRIISGLHASISMHICRDDFDQLTGTWGPNMTCFIDRIATHPDRLKHIYFNNVLLLRAVARLVPYLSAYDYCSTPEGVHEEDGGNVRTKKLLQNVMDIAKKVGRFDESVLFQGENANLLKEEFKVHFRNVSRIMDCVGCDKCRLWGKVQISGLGTALKVLFELDDKALDPTLNPNLLQRSEVVALINTLHRLTESLRFLEEFRQMWANKPIDEQEKILRSLGITQSNTLEKQAPSPQHDRSSLYTSLSMRWRGFLLLCQRSTAECLHVCVEFINQILNFFQSAFSPSGNKAAGPRDDL